MAQTLKNRELDPKLAAILASITERVHARSKKATITSPGRIYFSTFREAMLWLKNNPKSAIVRNPNGEGFMTLYPIK